MKMDLDAAAILKRILDAGVRPLRSMPAEEGIEVYRQCARMLTGELLDSGSLLDQTVASPADPMPICAYPSNGVRPRPYFIATVQSCDIWAHDTETVAWFCGLALEEGIDFHAASHHGIRARLTAADLDEALGKIERAASRLGAST